MTLSGVKKEGDWLFSEWRLTYRVGWEQICRAAALLFSDMEEPELLVGDAERERTVPVRNEKEVLSLREAGCLTVRGISGILRVPLSVTFFSQLDLVRATVASATKEFSEADYRGFNLSMCQFMDSAELAMYR